MLERSSSQPDDGRTHGAVTLQSQADARSELIGAAPTDDETNRKNMALLIQLRWTAVVGQIVTIGGVHVWLGIPLPLTRMGAVIGALVFLNVSSLVWVRHRAAITNNELLVALMLDVAALTAQLYLSGGATNPFTSLFLLQVTLGAVLLDGRSTWSLVALTCASFVWLTVAYRPLDLPPNPLSETYTLTVAGMLLGFVLNAVLLVVFVTRINRNLRQRDAHLAALRQHAAEQDHIVRMGLLASGAAHELGTPLASLSVILSDWRRMPDLAADQELAEDLAENGDFAATLQDHRDRHPGIGGRSARRRLVSDDGDGLRHGAGGRVARRALGAHAVFRQHLRRGRRDRVRHRAEASHLQCARQRLRGLARLGRARGRARGR
ncbi:signal transduction histidine kinase [Bradyrhizobium sp. LM4.3]